MNPRQVGKYEVRGLLGQGGMGAVMLAYDPDLDREVAIKQVVQHRTHQPQARERFLREARALARLSDPHVVQVHAFEPEADPPYLVMERLHGEDLKAVLRRCGPLSPAMVRDCAWQCLRGLAAAHAVGIVHRDIKPSNVMLCRDGAYKLLDFGLAASEDGDLTGSGEVVGTRRYLAPERVDGDLATASADVWALGVLVCELASGRHPWPPGAIVPDLLALPPGQPAEFNAWVLRLIDGDPAQRPQDAVQALSLLSGLPPALSGGIHDAPITETLLSGSGVSAASSVSQGAHSSLGSNSGSQAVVTATHRPLVVAPRDGFALPRPRLPLWLKLTAAIWLVSSLGAVAAGYAITERAVATQLASLRQTAVGIAVGASQLIDARRHRAMAADPVDEVDDIAALRERLARYAAGFAEVRNIYTMAELPETASTGVVQFVCDASQERDLNQDGVIGPSEAQAKPGQRYPAKGLSELLAGFTVAGVDHELTHDQWGTWTSAYAPLLLADGSSAGLVGIDIPAGHIAGLRRDFLWHSTALLATTLAAFLAAGLLIAWRMRRPVSELTRGMHAVANGDLAVEIDVRSNDEFGVLAQAFARMRDELRRAARLRAAFDGFVTRALAGRDGKANPRAHEDGARLVVAVRGGQEAAVSAVLAAARDHGGDPERVEAGSVCLVFPAAHDGDLPQERAVRCALTALSQAPGPGWACGVAVGGPPASLRALALARTGLNTGTDLLVDPAAYAAIAAGFFADQVHELDINSGQVLSQAWAVKGAVSSDPRRAGVSAGPAAPADGAPRR